MTHEQRTAEQMDLTLALARELGDTWPTIVEGDEPAEGFTRRTALEWLTDERAAWGDNPRHEQPYHFAGILAALDALPDAASGEWLDVMCVAAESMAASLAE